ncbi:MAG: acyl-CoA thioesterase [Symploca sp. SIO1B1]|nr:acyl-CoA thioesterase [Symploca sp. SIO1C2]NER99324.1 acyl-CoA thioesterase [Symploca sp. SIO1B1]
MKKENCVKNENFLVCVHTDSIPLRPNDFDWSLQLNNSVFLELLETGRWNWCLANNMDLRYHHLVGVVVRIEIDYIKPVYWDPLASLQVSTELEKIEKYSLYLQQTIEDICGVVIAKAKLRLALFDKERRTPVAINLEELQQLGTK